MSNRFATDSLFRDQEVPTRTRLYQLAQDITARATPDSMGIQPDQFAAIKLEIMWLVVILVVDVFGPLLSQTQPPPQGDDPEQGGDGERGDDGDDFRTPEQSRHPPSDDPPQTGGSNTSHQL